MYICKIERGGFVPRRVNETPKFCIPELSYGDVPILLDGSQKVTKFLAEF